MLKVKRNGKWIDICGGAPSTDSRVGSLFTGATMPLTFKGNTNSYENEYTYSSVQNITITGLSNIATITGNGSTNVVVKFDVTSSEDKIVPFLISVGDVDFQGRFFYYGKEVADNNCLAVCSLIAPDVGEVGELGVNYDIVESTSYPTFSNNVTNWNGYYSHQIEAFIFAKKSSNIGSDFLQRCYSFNQPLTLPSGVTNIGSNFLQYCYSFNQPLTLPSGVTSIGDYFLSNCHSFIQPLTLPSGVTNIGSDFLQRCYSFNQPLTLPSGVTSISNYFLSYCYSFNQSLTLPSGVTNISNYFLSNCYSFNQSLTLPSGVTNIGSNFLYNCYSLTRLEYNASVYPTENSSLSQNINTKTSGTGTGIKITGTNAEGLKSALPNKTSSPFRKLV